MSTHIETHTAQDLLNSIAADGGPNSEYLANPDNYFAEDVLEVWATAIPNFGTYYKVLRTTGGPRTVYAVRDPYTSTDSDWITVSVYGMGEAAVKEFYAPELCAAVQAYAEAVADSLRWECYECYNTNTASESTEFVESVRRTGYCEDCSMRQVPMSLAVLKEVNEDGYDKAVETLREDAHKYSDPIVAQLLQEAAESGAARILIGDEADGWNLKQAGIAVELESDDYGNYRATLVGTLTPENSPALPWPTSKQNGGPVQFAVEAGISRHYRFAVQDYEVKALLSELDDAEEFWNYAQFRTLGDEDCLFVTPVEQVEYWGAITLLEWQREELVSAIELAREEAKNGATDENEWLYSDEYLAEQADEAGREWYWDGTEA